MSGDVRSDENLTFSRALEFVSSNVDVEPSVDVDACKVVHGDDGITAVTAVIPR